MEEKTYWFAIDLRTALARTKTIFGQMTGLNEFKAMDKIEAMARRDYHAKVIRARLYLIDPVTGEHSEEPALLMDNVLPNGGHSETHETETSHACEKKADSSSGPSASFGSGWGKALPNPIPVVKLKLKENDNASDDHSGL